MSGTGAGETLTLSVALVPAAIVVVNGLTTRRARLPAGSVMLMLKVDFLVSLPVFRVVHRACRSACSATDPLALGATLPVTMTGVPATAEAAWARTT